MNPSSDTTTPRMIFLVMADDGTPVVGRKSGRRPPLARYSRSMRFGLKVPQGWTLDLVGIEPADQWRAIRDVAMIADQGPFDGIWVYDHFHTVPIPTEEAT